MENKEAQTLAISSPVFESEGVIPEKYTCEGEDVNPPLKVDNIPDGTQTLAIVVEDPDAPNGTFDHWIVWNIPPASIIEENRIPGISGINGAGKTGYHGPCPPSGSHRYYFYVFALDKTLEIEAGVDKRALHNAMKPHILAKGSLMGRYERTNKNNRKS